jgi:hypothetical protein
MGVALFSLPVGVGEAVRSFVRFRPQARVGSPAETSFPLPPRATTPPAATTSAATATTTPAAAATTATATASAATRFRGGCRRSHGKPGQRDSLKEVDSNHRNRRQYIRQGFQTYSTRHVSCHPQSLLANNASLDQHTPARQTHVSYRLPRPRLWRLKA